MINSLNIIHDIGLVFKRLWNKISEFMDLYTDNVFAGTIIFLALMFLSFMFIRSYTKK